MIPEKLKVLKINKASPLPPADQLAQQLTWLIADGVIQEGEKLPNIREYAQVLDIHHHTVRAAYHKLAEKDLVSVTPRVGTVVQAYKPFMSAPVQDYLNKEMIAILVPSMSDFYQPIISGIESVAAESNLIPFVVSCHDDPIYAEAIYRNLHARGVKGFINISLGFSDAFHSELNQKENMGIPLVFLDVPNAGTHSITIDTAGAIQLATEHLLAHGYDDLAIINCPSNWPIGSEAIKGFRQALEAHEKDFNQTFVYTVSNFGYDAGQFIVERMIQDNALPRGIVTVSDSLAIGALSALKDHNFRVPEDVAIIGFNDIPPSSFVDPPLTTIGLPLFEMGKQTMLAMNRVIAGNVTSWIQKSFSGQLVLRKSCGC